MRLLIALVALGVGLGGYLLAPVCWQTLSIARDDDVTRSALAFAARHPRIAAPFADARQVDRHLRARPGCCRILDRDDPFYATGSLQALFGRHTRVAEITLYSEELAADYTFYVWVDRCLNIIDFVGTES